MFSFTDPVLGVGWKGQRPGRLLSLDTVNLSLASFPRRCPIWERKVLIGKFRCPMRWPACVLSDRSCLKQPERCPNWIPQLDSYASHGHFPASVASGSGGGPVAALSARRDGMADECTRCDGILQPSDLTQQEPPIRQKRQKHNPCAVFSMLAGYGSSPCPSQFSNHLRFLCWAKSHGMAG